MRTRPLLQGLQILLIFFTAMGSATRVCPVPCNYQETMQACTCEVGHWTQIPLLSRDIKTFILSSCNISHLMSMSLKTGPNLNHLDLVKCGINRMADYAFGGLYTLTSLSLRDNKLVQLPKDSFADLQNLTTLNLQRNSLQVIPSAAICTLRRLRFLYLSQNKLNSSYLASCFNKLHELRCIDLSGNIFHSLSSKDFRNVCQCRIRSLILSNCKIQQLSRDTFSCFRNLELLSLSGNNIHHIGNDLFANVGMLTSLDIIGNPTVTFNSQSIGPLTRLHSLTIGSKTWKSFVFGPEFLKLSSLDILTIRFARVAFLKKNTVRFLVECPIRSLVVRDCGHQNVDSGWLSFLRNLTSLHVETTTFPLSFSKVFVGPVSPNITQVTLIQVHFEGIDNIGVSFRETNLENFVLIDSGIQRISKTLFGEMAYLRKLDISSNKITFIERQSFQLLPRLENLILKRNRLQTFYSAEWLGLGQHLTFLSLSGNLITTLDANSMKGYNALQILHLSQNAIKTFIDRPFLPATRLIYVNLRRNKITTIRSIGLPENLRSLRLDHNNIETITPEAFSNLRRLEFLSLSDNMYLCRGSGMCQDALRDLTTLRKLSLDGVGLPEVPSALLANLTNLEDLNLGRNAILTLGSRTFERLVSLKRLGLGGNRIATIDETMFMFMADTLAEVTLSDNPFACTCDLLWFRHFIMLGKVYFPELSMGHSYACASPKAFRRVPLLQFNISPYDCIDKMELGVAFGAFFTCLVLGIGGGLIVKYWWYLRYVWFQLQTRRKRHNEMQPQPRYRFDAFVCYHRDDRHWVIDHLLPNVEYDGGYRVCLHDRDWLGGIDIAENILVSIELSRKIICVLTNDFAASQWCQFEMAMAQHRLLDEGRDVLIPVLMGEIEGRHLTARLRHVLSTKTYLAWPADRDQEARFWKGLRKALKPRRAGGNANIAAPE